MLNNSYKIAVILDNIRSIYNVGAIFRTCEAAGVDNLLLCGITGYPSHSEKVKKMIEKTALGNIEHVNWKRYKSTAVAIKSLKKLGYEIVSIEQSKNSINYKSFNLTKNTAFVFGNEVDGISQKVLNISDKVLDLPMSGKAISLNVSTTVGIVLYHFKE